MSLESELPPEASLNPEDVSRILSYLELPSSSTSALPLPPLEFLNKYLPLLPFELALPFGQVTTPRQRAPIKTIKSRRLIHASSTPRPSDLTAERGRLRWPLLWERMGGTSLPPPTANVQEEESWVQDNFLSGREGSQHVKKLGGLLRGFEEEREMMDLVAARRAERRLDSAGEEFDEESDEELEPSPRLGPPNGVNGARSGGVPVPPEHVATVNEHEQEEIKRAFEKQLVELFVDGLDTMDYAEIDFKEPAGGDPTAEQDQADAYFDDEEPSVTSSDPVANGDEKETEVDSAAAAMPNQNGQGDYDY